MVRHTHVGMTCGKYRLNYYKVKPVRDFPRIIGKEYLSIDNVHMPSKYM